MSAEQRDELGKKMKGLYEKGLSIRDLCDTHDGLPYGTVHTLLKNAGTTFRRRGGTPGQVPPPTTDEQRRHRAQRPRLDSSLTTEELKVAQLMVVGHTNTEIALELGWLGPRVERRIASMLRKLQVGHRAALLTKLQDLASEPGGYLSEPPPSSSNANLSASSPASSLHASSANAIVGPNR